MNFLEPRPSRVCKCFQGWLSLRKKEDWFLPMESASFGLALIPCMVICKDCGSGYKTKSLQFLSLHWLRSQGNQLIRETIAAWLSQLGWEKDSSRSSDTKTLVLISMKPESPCQCCTGSMDNQSHL